MEVLYKKNGLRTRGLFDQCCIKFISLEMFHLINFKKNKSIKIFLVEIILLDTKKK